jgi:DNA polymerase I-like protein with 3'-5' exonuclease and polymerase domains
MAWNAASAEGGQMVGQISHISNCVGSKYPWADFEAFAKWAWQQTYLQIDIETDITDWWCTRKLISIQFGSCTSDRRQWFFQWSQLNDRQKNEIKKILESQRICKLAHNGAYEYVVLRFYGIIIENMYDTMLAEKVLRGGLENENYALADISWRYLRIMMDKTQQTNFGDDMITDEKILYGITDVAYLDTIMRQQYFDGLGKGVLNVIALENEALLAFSDITYEGMILDCEKWRENERLARPLVEEATKKINSWLEKEPFHSFAVSKGYLAKEDRITINFNAPVQKKELLQQIFPDIAGAGLPVLKAYVRDHGKALGTEKMEILLSLIEKNYEPFSRYLVANHRQYLEDHGYLIPAGTVTINWGSWQQVLPLFQTVLPKMKSTAEEERNKFSHPMLKDYERYNETTKLITDLGEGYIHKYMGPDGRVRTNFNQVVSTGRVSSSRPNMQNITVKEFVGTRYRNAFVCEPDCCFVSSDFTGQELAIIAYISKDPVWLEAIQNGWDLHSICAEMVYGKKWKDAAESDCAFYKMVVNDRGQLVQQKQKCSCKKHKVMRYDVKTINFGLAYGMSEIKLAGELDITVGEAMALIKQYFSVFPNIGRTLEFLGNFGVTNGYIMTLAPFFRKRWYPHWEAHRPWIEMHIKGIKYVPALGEIERASKNQPIQGSGADMMKVAMVLVRSYIRDYNLRDTIRLACQVHDQLDTVCKKSYAETWKPKFDELMREAAQLIVPTGILTADTQISEVWTK